MRILVTTALLLSVIALCAMTITNANTAKSSAPMQPPCSPTVTAVSPAMNEIGVPDSGVISITFGSAMDPSSYNDTTFIVHGSLSGPQRGVVWGDAYTLNLTQSSPFAPGEVVTVTATEGILCADGGYLEHGYSWQFTTEVDPSSPGEFIFDASYSAGERPYYMAAADLDGDGDPDMVTASYGQGTVSVWLNYGDGTFAPRVDYAAGDSCYTIITADIGGDGDLDLVICDLGSDSLIILPNNGDGTFAPSTGFAIANRPVSVVATDLDGNGAMDLAIVTDYSDNILVMLNSGSGVFALQTEYAAGASPRGITAVDLDRDGDQDLAVTNSSSDDVSILLNYGDGTFAPAANYPVGSTPMSIVAADLDSDGNMDLVSADWASRSVSILLNLGGGTFAQHVSYDLGAGIFSVIAADFDGDGDLDLAAAAAWCILCPPVWKHLVVTQNQGDGTFENEFYYPVGTFSISVITADFDGDGDMDLAAPSVDLSEIFILQNSTCCEGSSVGNVDCTGIIDIGDVTETIQKLFITLDGFCCDIEADIDQSGIIDIGDLTMLIQSLFITLNPLPACP